MVSFIRFERFGRNLRPCTKVYAYRAITLIAQPYTLIMSLGCRLYEYYIRSCVYVSTSRFFYVLLWSCSLLELLLLI